MSDEDRLFLAVVIMVAVYVFRVWEAKRRRHQAMMASHCAYVEIAKIYAGQGDTEKTAAAFKVLEDVEKGLGIRD